MPLPSRGLCQRTVADARTLPVTGRGQGALTVGALHIDADHDAFGRVAPEVPELRCSRLKKVAITS